MGNCTITLPGDTGTVVLEDNTVTLSNKTIASPTITGVLSATGDTNTFSSANSTDPLVVIKNTTNDANSARLRFVKDKGAAGADDDVAGLIEFYADDDNQDNILFAKITAQVADASNGAEGGKLSLGVATHDGEFQNGLIIADGSAEDEVDVTIGNGADSLTTIAGDLDIPNGGFALGSDASGDMYYRNSSGVLTRIAVGSDNHVLTLDGAVPGWEAAADISTFTNLSGSGTLQAVGATTLGSTLNVSGTATLAGTTNAQAITTTNYSGSGTMEVVGNTFIGGTLNVTGTVSVAAKIEHAGDTDTYIEFTADDINFQAGGVNFLDLTEDTQNEITVNEGGVDIDFRVETADESHMIFVEGSSNRMSIGDNTGSPGATLEVKNHASAGAFGVPLVQLNSNDTDKIALDINADNITANVVDILADAVTTAKVINVSADGLTTGNAFYVDDNSSDTGTRNTALIIQNNAAAIAATALHVQSDGGITGISLDKNFAGTAAATVTGFSVDMDKTAATTSDNTIYGLKVDMDNTTATNGTNTMYGLHVTPTLTHAANAGLPVVYGALINAQGGTNGTSIVQAARFEAGGGDLNYGIQLDVEDGGVDLRIESSADSGDYFQIQTTTHGATTITTVDDDAAAADLTLTIDGDIALNPAGDFSVTADTNTFSSANSADPLVIIKNTTNDAGCARLRFVKDKGAAGAANDDVGIIQFYGDDANQDQVLFGRIRTRVAVHTNGQEGGKMQFAVASHDGELNAGLTIGDGDAEDEVDVTIGNGADSLTTIAGDLDIPNGGFALGSDASGDMYYRNSSGVLTRIAVGSDNHVLTLDGAVPGWESPAAGDTFTNLSGSGTLQAVGNVFFGAALNVTGAGIFAGDLSVGDDLSLTSDSAVFNMGAGNDFTITHDGTTGATLAGTPISINSTGNLTLDSTTDIVLSGSSEVRVENDLRLDSDSSVLSMGANDDITLTHDGTTGLTIAANPFEVDSGGSITLDSHTGIFIFQDANTEVLRFTEGNSGDVTIKLAVNGKDLVFTDNGDATNMKILDAAAGINVPGEVQTTKIAYTDGDDAITIADGGGVTFSSTVKLVDDKTLTFGSNDDWTIEYDEDGDDDLVMTGQNLSIESSTSQKPVLMIKNTTNDANSAVLRFVKDKGAAGAANDVAGMIEFYADDAAQDQVLFGRIASQVSVHTNGQEGGLLAFQVASHDGEINNGLVITDGSAEDEIDVTIGNGADSLTTVAGDLAVTGADVVVGGDSDGTDRTVTFGHSTLKTIMGIDDSADAFVLNTDASFDGTLANNSLSIDANHKMIVGGSIRSKGELNIHYCQYNTTADSEKAVPMYIVAEAAAPGSADSVHSIVAPFDGILKRAFFRSEAAQDGNVDLRIYAMDPGTAVADWAAAMEKEFVQVSAGGAAAVTVFNPTGSSHFSAGQAVMISIDPAAGPHDVNLTLIFEYNTSGL
tara:strand:- start:2905 stop:7251 length:4347 start_codon:yes stop_codon:yes gene_type:complete